jgi:Flp pilus assembly protein TadD
MLGKINLMLGNFETSVSHYEKAHALKPEDKEINTQLPRARDALRKYKQLENAITAKDYKQCVAFAGIYCLLRL